jgi:DNA modification methylase
MKYASKNITIWLGDCLQVLRRLPAEQFHCVVTSPPYYGLRDYQLDPFEWPATEYVPMLGAASIEVPAMTCCLGQEPTIDAYIAHLVEIYSEVCRVLRDDGTFWLNLGDTIRNKNVGGIPWRVAFALQATGWYLRSDIIWRKPNPMPSSAKDRPTLAHEYFFLFSKTPEYYYDRIAVAEPAKYAEQHHNKASSWGKNRKHPNKANAEKCAIIGNNRTTLVGGMRNKHSVWDITTKSYTGAHCAVFPPELPLTPILAGTSERGCCGKCGKPYTRIIEDGEEDREQQKSCDGNAQGAYFGKAQKDYAAHKAQNASEVKARILRGMRKKVTIGWQKQCKCFAPVVPCTVLDPFMGSGTTAMVSLQNGRRVVGIEASESCLPLIEQRCNLKLRI